MNRKLVALAVLMVGIFASVAGPLQAGTSAYGGIGATVANFYAANPHGVGDPPAGKSYYRVDSTRNGRVLSYHMVVGRTTKPSASEFLTRLTGRELPHDAQLVKPYDGYCAVYGSPWLGKVAFGLPRRLGGRHVFTTAYVIVYAPEHEPSFSAVNVSLAPACRG